MMINCIFEGGGIKGLAYIGALRFLESRGFKIKKVGGTSIGSVFASLIAAGFNSYQLEELVSDFNINIVTNNEDTKVKKLITSIKEKGIHSISNFERYIDSLLRYKNKQVFQDFKFGEDYLLKMIAMDAKRKKQVILPNDLIDYHYNIDTFRVAKAVAMSCSMPVYFRPYKLDNNLFYDGGVLNNFPITLFKEDDLPTLGFRLQDNKTNIFINNFKKSLGKEQGQTIQLDKYNIIDIQS